MSPDTDSNDGGTDHEDRSDETLTPKEAWRLTEENGMMGKTVASLFDISEARVSQLKGQYSEGIEKGKESVDPGDFSPEELEEALGDSPTDNPYKHTCPECNAVIESPDSPGVHPCPDCEVDLEWGKDEI